MEIQIDFTKSAQENASDYFEKSKKARKKVAGAKEAIEELQKMLENEKKSGLQSNKPKLKLLQKHEWYEKFNWFYTSNGMLAIGGSDAQQNELINSRYFEDRDLFFHADIYGGSVVILKRGEEASREIKEEVAQFAACYSRAWGQRLSAVDVYAARRNQVTKSKERGSLATGAFLIKGEREWYKDVQLELAAFVEEAEELKSNENATAEQTSFGYKRLRIVPGLTIKRLGIKKYVEIKIGEAKKSDAAKYISKILGYDDLDYIMRHLPSGTFSMAVVK